jgi:two-component system sensor histidine kinase ChvG
VRLAVFAYVMGAAAVAAVLSLMVSTTISRPLKKLRGEALALLDRRGRLTGSFQGSSRLDEIGDLSRALAELSRRLEERMRFIESFAADVSHEFKNPLTSIRAAAEMLKEVDDPRLKARFADIAEKDIARLERLLTAVRDVTLVDSGIDAGEREAVDVADISRSLLSAERYRRVEIRTPETPLPVEVPGDRIAQILENLLDNASSFTPASGKIRLSLERDGAAVRILVEDDGPGVPEEHRARIFERFFSYRPNAERTGTHSGLGLAIVKAIAERYGGALALVDSSLGGAGFEVRLPASAKS